MKRIVVCILSIAFILGTLTSCRNIDKSDSAEMSLDVSDNSELISNVDSEPEKQDDTIDNSNNGINFLTGETLLNPNANGKRPVAVMINNIKASLPQYGVGAADILFEIPVEGGITRLMGVYHDFTNIPKICSVRSCRYYYPIIALGMDAVYIHWGSDPSIARETLKRTGINRFEGEMLGAELFGRDPVRKKTYAYEHIGYFDGTKLPAAMDKYKYRKDISDKFSETLFNFSDSQVVPAEKSCLKVIVNFSKSYFSTFIYDTNTQTYKKQHSGQPHIDSATGNQLEFKNVIILQTVIKNRTNSKLLDVNLTKGTGKYISNGAVEDIFWSKANENAPIVLTKKDGSNLNINKGKSYIAIIGNEKTISIS